MITSMPYSFRKLPESETTFWAAYDNWRASHPWTPTYLLFTQLNNAQAAGDRAVRRLYKKMKAAGKWYD